MLKLLLAAPLLLADFTICAPIHNPELRPLAPKNYAAMPTHDSSAPINMVARANFPNENGEDVDRLANVNSAVNSSLTYQDDQSHYGVRDLWVTNPPDNRGDCEDYVLTKEFRLSENGFPTTSNTKIVMVAGITKGQRYGHALLAVKMPHGSVAYLDMAGVPMSRKQMVAKGYEFFDWQA